MCGIVGIVAQHNIVNTLLECLCRLEYRGYDSSGIAVVDEVGNMVRLRRLGKVQTLIAAAEKLPICGSIGIAHTRWATHGKPSENNAHPHISKNILVVHNGVIENYKSLRKSLQIQGYVFFSETDTEVIAHLIHLELTKCNSLRKAVIHTISQLYGSYSVIIMDSRAPYILFAVCSGSPLVIGLGNKKNFISSDQFALLPITRRFIFLEEGDITEVTSHSVNIFDKSGTKIIRQDIESDLKHNSINKGTYHYYMQKEIYEQPYVIKNTITGRISSGIIDLSELGSNANKIFTKTEHIQIIACGTSYNSGMVSRYWFEELAGIPCDVEIASEFRYRKPAVRRNSLIIALSQSGETADTLAALRFSKKMGYLGSLAICNVAESSLVRESDFALMTKAGIEISVASTKSFISQLVVLLMLVAKLIHLKDGAISIEHDIIQNLQVLPSRIKQILSRDKYIKQIARDFYNKHHDVLFLGRDCQYPIALEGALKLKEVSYIHAEAYAAGELKHGPLALIDADVFIIVLAPGNKIFKKIQINIEEVQARGVGQLYIFTDRTDEFINHRNIHIIEMPYIEDIILPILYTIPLQLLAYHVALVKGTDIDRPRNLAKSVTVE